MPRKSYPKRADGRYQSKVYLGGGKYKYIYALTQKELQEKINESKILLGKGINLSAQNDTFDFWGKKWLKFKKSEVSAGWYNALTINYKKLDCLYNVPLSKIKPSDIKEVVFDLAEQNYSKSIIKSVKNIAVGVFNLAIENNVIDSNPAVNISLPKRIKPADDRRALTIEEQRWIIDTPHRAQVAAMIMMFAGLRRGELIPLQWTDIDLQAGTISITKSVEMINGHPQTKQGGKTDAATRTVYMPKILKDFLQKADKKTLLVCPAESGKMMSNSSWRRLWESYICDLNFKYGEFDKCIGKKPKNKYQPEEIPIIIPRFTAHWLRHTFITSMYLAGVDIMTAKEQAGHSSIQTTLKIYTHLDTIYKQKSVDKFDSYLYDNFLKKSKKKLKNKNA